MSKGNKRCPCGSGKKAKNCCAKRKQRNTSIKTDMGKPVVVNGVRVSSTGEFELLKNGEPLVPASAVHEVSYDRPRKAKVLNRVPLDPNCLSSSHNLALKGYDLLFAVDTNTMRVNDVDISVCCVVLCKLALVDDDAIDVEYAAIHCLEFHNIKEKQENVAWVRAIKGIPDDLLEGNQRIGLVVDSDLGNIAAYNQRELPIYSEFYLPSGIELVYASSDVGKEFLLNQLIAHCDKESRC